MKLFAIKDDTMPRETILGYLIYYENHKAFYIELPDGADRWDTPMILSSFAARGQYHVDSYWSRIWIQNRIVPQDRQNISQVLHDNGLAVPTVSAFTGGAKTQSAGPFRRLILPGLSGCPPSPNGRKKFPEIKLSRNISYFY